MMSVTRSGELLGTKGNVKATFPNGTINVKAKYNKFALPYFNINNIKRL